MGVLVHSPGAPAPHGSTFVDGDGLAPSGDFEAHLVFELGGNAFAAPPSDLLNVEFGEDDGHPERLTTSAGQRPVFERTVDGFDDGCCFFVAAQLRHRGLRQIAALGHLPLVMGLDHHRR